MDSVDLMLLMFLECEKIHLRMKKGNTQEIQSKVALIVNLKIFAAGLRKIRCFLQYDQFSAITR